MNNSTIAPQAEANHRAIPDYTCFHGIRGCVYNHTAGGGKDPDGEHSVATATPLVKRGSFFEVYATFGDDGSGHGTVYPPDSTGESLSAADLRTLAMAYEAVPTALREAADILDNADNITTEAARQLIGGYSIDDIFEACDSFGGPRADLLVAAGSDLKVAARIKGELDRLGKSPLDEDE